MTAGILFIVAGTVLVTIGVGLLVLLARVLSAPASTSPDGDPVESPEFIRRDRPRPPAPRPTAPPIAPVVMLVQPHQLPEIDRQAWLEARAAQDRRTE